MWGKGPKDAQVMVVAEAPGNLEDRAGRPMLGNHGKMLDTLLESAGLERSEVYITHAVKCKPPEGSSPSKTDVKTCKPYLLEEIDQIKPKYIVTLGANALHSVLGKSKITEMHGQAQEWHGITLFPTFHPAMALRDPARLPALRKDFTKLGHLMAGNVPVEEDMHWRVIRSLEDWNEFVEHFEQTEVFSFDLETTGLDENAEMHSVGVEKVAKGKMSKEAALSMYGPCGVNTMQIGLDDDTNWSLPLIVKDSPWREDHERQCMFIETLVEMQGKKKAVGHNAKFDNRWLKKHYGVKFRLDFDTMLAHHLIDENSPHGLKELAAEFCNAPSYDVPLRVKLGLWKNDQEKLAFYKYGCFDVHWTLELYYLFRRELVSDRSQSKLFSKLVMRSARMFEDVEEDGHYIELDRLEETRSELHTRKAAIEKQMNALMRKCGVKKKVNWNAPAQIANAFYKTMKLPVLEKTGKGAPSTAETVLLRLAEEYPIAKLLMDWRGVDKDLSTYVDGWRSLMHGDRLYLSTKLHGTVTGRYASRLHQVPRDPVIRGLIDAPGDDDWTFVSGDYSQIELRIAAMLSNDPRMKMIFQTGGDIHAETASFILGKPASQLTKEERKMAKPVNFGFLYGMGWPKFIIYARDNYGVDFSEKQAEAYRKRYFETYAALPKWHERQRRCVRAFGQVVSLSGRIRHLPGIYSSEKGIRAEAERQGINSPVQGFGSGDLKAMAMVEIHDTFSRDDVRIKGEVHDSILMWVRTSKLKKLLPRIRAIMEAPALLEEFGINFTVPIVADFDVGRWGHGLAAVFDGDRLKGFKKDKEIITYEQWREEAVV